MKERPILFSGEMVQAILDGRKTQTRRVIKPQPKLYSAMHRFNTFIQWKDIDAKEIFAVIFIASHCPYGQPGGDRLWVRETWAELCATDELSGEVDLAYKATGWPDGEFGPDRNGKGWRPAIFMPRWASRITLEVTGVRVERLQDISYEDAEAEGAPIEGGSIVQNRRIGFEHLWDSINAKRGYGWDANPWVWVIKFRRVESGTAR